MSEVIDLGSGVTFRWLSCAHGEQTNAIIRFEPEHVEGLVCFCNECDGETWTIDREHLTLNPSVDASEVGGRHGWVRDGRWVQ